ncbi:hypothetical protein GCM10023176_39110 [Micromonospora coerulea]|uniref:Uncharacterized protein n=1 Tax=Micromonospora coerulea TaxID=47856 RepID=A0ABP8SSB1_9ACTN
MTVNHHRAYPEKYRLTCRPCGARVPLPLPRRLIRSGRVRRAGRPADPPSSIPGQPDGRPDPPVGRPGAPVTHRRPDRRDPPAPRPRAGTSAG